MASPPLDFTRADYLGTRALLIGGLLAVPITWVEAVTPWVRGDALTQTVHLDGSAPVTDPTVSPGVQVHWEGAAQLTIPDASATVWLAHLTPGLLLGVALLLVLVPLLRLTTSVQRGDAFTDGTVRWLRTVALTVLLAPWIVLFTRGAVDAYLLSAAFGERVGIWVSVSGATVAISAVGAVTAVMAEAFRRGLRLEHDVTGLV